MHSFCLGLTSLTALYARSTFLCQRLPKRFVTGYANRRSVAPARCVAKLGASQSARVRLALRACPQTVAPSAAITAIALRSEPALGVSALTLAQALAVETLNVTPYSTHPSAPVYQDTRATPT